MFSGNLHKSSPLINQSVSSLFAVAVAQGGAQAGRSVAYTCTFSNKLQSISLVEMHKETVTNTQM